MTMLDRYVGRIVLGAFAAALLFFLSLTILIDLLNNMTRYADRAESQGKGVFALALDMMVYYAKLMPVLFTTVTPFATVIACMFSVARLQNANEVVAMLFVGKSIRRVLAPMLLCGVCAGVAMAACWQWIVPHVGASVAAEGAALRFGSAVQTNLVHETQAGDDNQYLYIREFDPRAKTMRGIRMLTETTLALENSMVSAESATWDEGRADWRLVGGRLMTQRTGAPLEWLGRSDVSPALLLQRSRDTIDPETLSYTDLLDLVETRPNRPDFRLALHRHITYPLSNVLFLLLALPLAVWYERGSRLRRLLAAIVLCGGYTLMDLTCQSLSQQGLHPIVAAWSPVIAFGALGIVLFGSTRT